MNGIQRRKVGSTEKSYPSCLGRMVNLFDLSTGVSRHKLLTDTPHREGSSLSRCQSDVARVFKPPLSQTEVDTKLPELLRTSKKKANGTPVKMLMDQEMSEMECKHNPPNVVAKLMGLETLPQQRLGSSVQRTSVRSYSKRRVADYEIPLGCRERDDILEKELSYEVNGFPEQNEYRDVYETWHQSQQTNYIREKLPLEGMNSGNANDRKMTLVRQKFLEAKRLATDEKLRQSKEFQDALEVLSSNKDLFVKFLHEPSSLFSQHPNELGSIPPSPETKRITVLRPSKISGDERFTGLERKSHRQLKKPAQIGQSAFLDKKDSRLSPPVTDMTNEYAVASQPTRIVVLKPSPGKNRDIKPVVSPPSSLPRMVESENLHEENEDDGVKESRKFARKITQQMCDNLMGHRRDETLLSSVFSNGYTGDESSFEISENDYAMENLSDLEVVSSSSRHSWDYVNRYGSPYSSSSFSRISCSPESSVCREAKKRLSERWALMASHGSYQVQEQRHVRRSSSTLGEMLALSDAKKSTLFENEVNKNDGSELEPYLNGEENLEYLGDSPKTLVRSKSVPGPSALFGARLNVETSHLGTVKADDQKLLEKSKGVKSSFNGKVSSLFFSRNKKTSKEKYSGSHTKDKSQSLAADTPTPMAFVDHSRRIIDAASHADSSGLEDCSPPVVSGSPGNSLQLTNLVTKGGLISHEAGWLVKRPLMSGNNGDSQEQPSPISVLEPPFLEDDNRNEELSSFLKPANQEFSTTFMNSLIDKSPHIESIARNMPWDGSCSGSSASRPLKSSPVSADFKEEQNWHCLVESLLTVSGLGREVSSNLMFTRWYSHVSPLDPSLRDTYANLASKEAMHEAKRRQSRSNRKLVFDCVNAALVDIKSQELDQSRKVKIHGAVHDQCVEATSLTLLDCILAKLKDWASGEVRCILGDDEDGNNLVVESVVRKEVVGRDWVEHLSMEMDNFGKEVEGRLLEELLEEAVLDFTGY